MECKNCGKNIDSELEYCDNCTELNNLIEENKELNKLEITKEVETLSNFKDEKKEDEMYLMDELKDLINIDSEEKSNNKILIIVFVVIGLLLILILSLILFFNKEEKVEEEIKIDYKKVINDYGKSIENALNSYLDETSEIPTWVYLSELIEYNEYKVVCKVHDIYTNKKIYLNKCSVDGKNVEYSYGKKEENTNSNKINIYKTSDNKYITDETEFLAGTITCSDDTCKFIKAYDTFAIIKENDKYYLYNYINDEMKFGPLSTLEDNILEYESTLYGILYDNGKDNSIYNVNTEKTINNIEGDLIKSAVNYNPEIIYKYGYAIFKVENKNNFINLKSGNTSYSIDGDINSFIENIDNNIVYMTTYNSTNSKIKIYNSNGKSLFEGKEFNEFRLINEDVIVYDDTNYYIYDSNLKIKIKSKKYNKILGVYDEFAVVVNNNYLELLDLNDNNLATYDLKWDKTYSFNHLLSGKVKEENNNIIYLFIEKENNTYKYYYNCDTKKYGLK